MNKKQMKKILTDMAHTRVSCTAQEKEAAEYLAARCEELGVKARLESFGVETGDVSFASLKADGSDVPCTGYKLCGSGSVKAPFLYLPHLDKASLAEAKGKIVMVDGYLGLFPYKDIVDAGALGFITYDGNVRYADRDIDSRAVRADLAEGRKILGVNVNAKDAAKLVKAAPKEIEIRVEQKEYTGESHNVVAELPGESDEWIVLTAHYDSTPLSPGVWDNMSGCVGILGMLEAAVKASRDKKLRYGVRLVFCGSEERGLLGSKAYVAAHEAELGKVALNINLDMIGSAMGKFIAVVSAEKQLVDFIKYYSVLEGWSIEARSGVYSSDSTPFADKGVPAVSFARIATANQATIHGRYDTMEVMSMPQLEKDIDFLSAFVLRFIGAPACPVGREMPDDVKKQLDEYLGRKRKDQ